MSRVGLIFCRQSDSRFLIELTFCLPAFFNCACSSPGHSWQWWDLLNPPSPSLYVSRNCGWECRWTFQHGNSFTMAWIESASLLIHSLRLLYVMAIKAIAPALSFSHSLFAVSAIATAIGNPETELFWTCGWCDSLLRLQNLWLRCFLTESWRMWGLSVRARVGISIWCVLCKC